MHLYIYADNAVYKNFKAKKRKEKEQAIFETIKNFFIGKKNCKYHLWSIGS